MGIDTYNYRSNTYKYMYIYTYNYMSVQMMMFNDFNKKQNLKNKATSNIKIQQVLSTLSSNDVGIYLRDGPFESDIGIVNLHPSKGTHWVVYKSENYFDSYGCALPQKLSKFIIIRKGYCLYSDYKIQGLTSKRDSYCASYCLYILYLKKVSGTDFKSAVLNLFHPRFS